MSRHKKSDCECTVNCCSPEILDIIRGMATLNCLVDDVFKCISCRPSSRRLQEILASAILNDVRRIEYLLTNDTVGLSKIKDEIIFVENMLLPMNNEQKLLANEVHLINNNVNHPTYGLSRINSTVKLMESETRLMNNSINHSIYGLNGINNNVNFVGNEVHHMNNCIHSPIFGLREIKKDLHLIADTICDKEYLTTGPVFIHHNAKHLGIKVLNNTCHCHTVHVRVKRIDKHPFKEIFDKHLEIEPMSCNEFRYIDLENDEDGICTGEFEVIISKMRAGLYPTVVQFCSDDRLIYSTIFKPADFIAPCKTCRV